jgi:hypothetical protein
MWGEVTCAVCEWYVRAVWARTRHLSIESSVGRLDLWMSVGLLTSPSDLQDSTFHAPLRPKRLTEEAQAMKLQSVVGYGDTEWYSTGAPRCMQPICDMLAARDAAAVNAWDSLEKVWLCRLVGKRNRRLSNTHDSIIDCSMVLPGRRSAFRSGFWQWIKIGPAGLRPPGEPIFKHCLT